MRETVRCNTNSNVQGGAQRTIARRAKEQQLDMRRHVKALFDSYAANSRAAGGSVIEKEAFIEMMVKHGDEFKVSDFDPNKDMPELDESERVTFTKFELCDSMCLFVLSVSN